ncbi:MAG: hypothetical protein A07HN63_00253 [uncultured archaeon A07HN63]|nr:MAG: hypothetical protein A07HN63_00253 [uncultured archaeon A07HN63]
MLRPEQMSKVSVTGSKRVMDDVIEAVHSLNLLDLSDYDGSWEKFEGGRSLEGADEINEKLVTVRALESSLDIGDDDGGQTRIVDREELDAELPELRDRINELDDERSELETRIRETAEEIEAIEPFADLGLDLDLLSGYDSLGVLVGQGPREAIETALDDAAAINRFAVFSGTSTHAIFAQPAEDHDADSDLIADALVGVEFTTLSVPDAEAAPEEYVTELEQEKSTLEAELDEVEAELETVKAESAGFLLAAEEYLTIEAQKNGGPALVCDDGQRLRRRGLDSDRSLRRTGDHPGCRCRRPGRCRRGRTRRIQIQRRSSRRRAGRTRRGSSGHRWWRGRRRRQWCRHHGRRRSADHPE